MVINHFCELWHSGINGICKIRIFFRRNNLVKGDVAIVLKLISSIRQKAFYDVICNVFNISRHKPYQINNFVEENNLKKTKHCIDSKKKWKNTYNEKYQFGEEHKREWNQGIKTRKQTKLNEHKNNTKLKKSLKFINKSLSRINE